MSASDFLTSHWQRSPLHLPTAICPVTPSLTPDELAWLATQDDVESRLVFTEHEPHGADCQARYRVEDGPFDQDQLTSLPDSGWTLLVQDVEKHLPDFRQLLSQVDFIPDWRIDDIMVSFATPGGSVGPHKDNYDVFLCQGSGRRKWHIGDPEQASRVAREGQLSLLQAFTDPAATIVSEGDVLYLPPGVAHWGIAQNACMTYSIGMRAPTMGELLEAHEQEFPDAGDLFEKTGTDRFAFYTDADLCFSESFPGCISTRTIERLSEQIQSENTLSRAEIATVLGCTVTGLKPWLTPEPPSNEDLAHFSRAGSTSGSFPVHGMARIAWWTEDNLLLVFGNGFCRRERHSNLEFFRILCAERMIAAASIWQRGREDLIGWLLRIGVFDLHGPLEENSPLSQSPDITQ